MSLSIAPCTLRFANAYVIENHRHHGPSRGHKFSMQCIDEQNCIHGVVIVGRPVNRVLDNGTTCEVLRLCTDGTKNACSILYSAARRVAFAMGYHRIITYILESEPGTSLLASGWIKTRTTNGGSWDTPSRHREDSHPIEKKVRWESWNKNADR